jgi:DNA methylase
VEAALPIRHGAGALEVIDWSFLDEPAQHPLHSLHPYPAKFVPALPRRVIAALTEPGDLVLDPFAGSGTALVEALLQGRRAVGGDLNPVARVAAAAKTAKLNRRQLGLLRAASDDVVTRVDELMAEATPLPLPNEWEPTKGRRFKGLKFWFSEDIARELSALRLFCQREQDSACRNVMEMCLSAIVVAVSWQDSDTRYVRREKKLEAGTPTRLFRKRLVAATTALADGAASFLQSGDVFGCDARLIDYAGAETVKLAITSPPYPNAWSYHLYHQNRILWLGGDPWEFKAQEIGHHRSYSAAAGEGEGDFRRDMTRSLAGVRKALRQDGHAVVVVGDSVVRGELIRNDEVLIRAGTDAGLRFVNCFDRVINPKRKAFNPSIGKIKHEHVLVFAR